MSEQQPRPRPFFRESAEGGGEIIIPTGAGGHVVVDLTIEHAFQLSHDVMGWLKRRIVTGQKDADTPTRL